MTASVDLVNVRGEHQERLAFVYVRQSSPRQVRNHLESRRLQYGFAEQAVALGWARERIIVLDDDQGQSASLPRTRGGFGAMVAAVARGEAGIVMSFEMSRLSRNDLDWHQLVYRASTIRRRAAIAWCWGSAVRSASLSATASCIGWWKRAGTRHVVAKCS